MTKLKYKFKGRDGGKYVWESVQRVAPNDSRHEKIRCSVDWFWSSGRKPRVFHKLEQEHGARKTMELLPEFDPAHGGPVILEPTC